MPEVDEEEEEKTVNALPVVPPHPEESPKTFKRKTSLVELVLVSVHHRSPLRRLTAISADRRQDVAFLMGRRVKGMV